MTRKSLIILILIISLVTLLNGCSNEGSKTYENEDIAILEKVTVVLDWVPNTTHTGLFVAKDKGWYKEQGLDVNIIQPNEVGTAQLVASGKAQFGISYQGEVTYARANQLPVVSIAAIIQHNTSGFAAPIEKKIASPKDFEGKKYGGWGSPIERAVIKTVMGNEGADVRKVEYVNVGSRDFFTAMKSDVDFEWINYGWTGIEAKLKGYPINFIELTRVAPELESYSPVIIVNEKYIKEHSKTIKKFMAATAKGYQYAINRPKEAANILLGHVTGPDKELVLKSQEWISNKYQEDALQWGIQQESVWMNYTQWMVDQGLIPQMIDISKAFTNQFLPDR
ncbi:ABC transporter substrate-binding protein [Vulcanibacillus modesticaldus]|uniref:ABC transporter substrate-binding protein n=1 Tax=Vulcanibacillus modesticaldus TaxID=337097 RepID=A0A1D2YWY0_9BACI|nr:ABC transporter substrate-binding protein [Vulcanibacillus modesticaldus]OEG00229.1 ABC transporter substrate-binding protein [Vulcanibacillus modesticaldus]